MEEEDERVWSWEESVVQKKPIFITERNPFRVVGSKVKRDSANSHHLATETDGVKHDRSYFVFVGPWDLFRWG